MSSSPDTRRNLKPSPIAPAQQNHSHNSAPTNLPTLQPAAPIATAGQESNATSQPPPTPTAKNNSHKRKSVTLNQPPETMASPPGTSEASASTAAPKPAEVDTSAQEPKAKKSRTNTPWTPAEELRLKQMRDAGNSWSEIAKTFPQRTEGSVKKHWYKDMHYAEFAEDEVSFCSLFSKLVLIAKKSTALLAAIKEYDANKWKVIGQKVGKPAKYAKEHFGGRY